MQKHPNSTTATGLGGVGLLTVYLLGHFGVQVGAEEATLISGGMTSLGLLVGRRGVVGLWRLLMHGSEP